MKIHSTILVTGLILQVSGCFAGGGKKGADGGRPSPSNDSSGTNDQTPPADKKPIGESFDHKPDSSSNPTPASVIAGASTPANPSQATNIPDQTMGDAEVAALNDVKLKAIEPVIGWGPVAEKIGTTKLVCKYSALSYSGDVNVTVSWQASADGFNWKKLDRGDDFLLLTDAENGQKIKCIVSASDSSGKNVTKESLAVN